MKIIVEDDDLMLNLIRYRMYPMSISYNDTKMEWTIDVDGIEVCPECGGLKNIYHSSVEPEPCGACEGKGYYEKRQNI